LRRRGYCATSRPTGSSRGEPLAELPPGRRLGPAGVLFVARVVYAFSWYNVGAVLPIIGSALHAGPAQLGVVLGAFLLGVGVFQVPAGLLAVRYGARPVSLAGLALLGGAGLASALAPTWPVLAILRGIAGIGAAMFFSPALGLIASYFPAGQRGPVIGLYNGGFSLGGALGLFGGAALGVMYGWSAALAFGGIALLAMTAVSAVLLPPQPADRKPRPLSEVWVHARRILTSRSIWALSLGLTGFWSAIYVVAQDFVSYSAADHGAWGIGAAAAIVTGLVLASFPGGPVGGWLAERSGSPRRLAVLFTVLSAGCVAVIPFLPLALLVPDLIALGFIEGIVFAILYLIPSYLPESHGESLALGVGVVNSIQVTLGSAVAVAFGFLAAADGYGTAWEFAALLTVGLLPILALLPPVTSGAWGPASDPVQ
jgi:MFS family permease